MTCTRACVCVGGGGAGGGACATVARVTQSSMQPNTQRGHPPNTHTHTRTHACTHLEPRPAVHQVRARVVADHRHDRAAAGVGARGPQAGKVDGKGEGQRLARPAALGKVKQPHAAVVVARHDAAPVAG
jgi:hypothetical protein